MPQTDDGRWAMGEDLIRAANVRLPSPRSTGARGEKRAAAPLFKNVTDKPRPSAVSLKPTTEN